VPAYSSLGLTDATFEGLSTVVIGILSFITAWAALRSKRLHGSRKATISQFMKSYDSCIKCGAENRE
jgi:hypothetical protein